MGLNWAFKGGKMYWYLKLPELRPTFFKVWPVNEHGFIASYVRHSGTPNGMLRASGFVNGEECNTAGSQRDGGN
jgi:hypothetical protein